jgi:hypothetical protein
MADPQAHPSSTMSVAYGTGQSFQTGRYTGVSLWDLLQEAGVKNTTGKNNNKLRAWSPAPTSAAAAW